jgi:glucokinase
MKMQCENVAIGVDIGGTKIKVGAVTLDGRVVGTPILIATGATDPQEIITDRIIKSITSVIEHNHLSKACIQGIGLGVTGPLDVKSGTILQCLNLPTLNFFPLRSMIEKQFLLKVRMNNDANAMIFGESIWGAGKDFETVLGITLGTGLGCAIIINKKILMGATETAGEICISPYKDGIIEDVVSGNGISKMYKEVIGKTCSAVEIADFARQGDKQAIFIWEEFGKAVAFALSWAVNLIDPEVVVIGGSIANAMELFLPSLTGALRKNICPVPAQNLRIVKAELGDNAGFVGAAALAWF